MALVSSEVLSVCPLGLAAMEYTDQDSDLQNDPKDNAKQLWGQWEEGTENERGEPEREGENTERGKEGCVHIFSE